MCGIWKFDNLKREIELLSIFHFTLRIDRIWIVGDGKSDFCVFFSYDFAIVIENIGEGAVK